jgi:uncharacterized protein YgiM (DUF1202 family)
MFHSVKVLVLAVLLTVGLVIAGGLLWSRPRQAPPPAPEDARIVYVAAPEVFVRKAPARRSEALARLEIGQEVRVSRATQPGEGAGAWHKVLGGPGAQGWLAAEELSTEPPSSLLALQRAKDALSEGRLDEAVEEAERATALEERLREAWDILAAVHDARGDVQRAREVYPRRARLPAPPKPQDEQPIWGAPRAGEKRHVAATRLRVREAASRDAKVLSELPLNTEVEVLSVDGDFARVRWTSSDRPQWLIDFTQEVASRRVDGGTATHEGFAAAAFLSPEPWSVTSLLARATSAESEGRMLDEARALERAALLDGNPDTMKRLVRAAVKAGLYPLAATTAVKLSQAPTSSEQPAISAELEFLFGCQKDPPLEVAASCLAEVDTVGACPPCQPTDPGLFIDEDTREEEKAQLEAEHARAQVEYERELAEHGAAQEKLELQARRLRERYPTGPWFHAVVEGDDALAASGMKVVVYTVHFNIGGYCGNYETTRGLSQVSGGEIPWPKRGEALELWARGSDYQDVLWGVVAVKSPAEVHAWFAGDGPFGATQLYTGEPSEFGPKPNVVGPFTACNDCCGC